MRERERERGEEEEKEGERSGGREKEMQNMRLVIFSSPNNSFTQRYKRLVSQS